MPYISVVVPAYNEEKRLPLTLQRIASYLDSRGLPWEIVIVDDGSSDQTADMAEVFAARLVNVHVVHNDHRGKGYAVRTGMLKAKGRFILFSDADLSTPIESADDLLDRLEAGYDVVIGSREGLGARRIGEPSYRHLMGRVFNWLVRLLAVGDFQDTQCGFKMFRGEVAHDLFSRAKLYGVGARILGDRPMVTGFDVEILYLGCRLGYRIIDVPVQWTHFEGSKVNPLKDSMRMLGDVIRVRWKAWRGEYD